MFNLTGKIQILFIWFWTQFVLPALNLLKGKIADLTTTVTNLSGTVAGKVDTTTYNQYVATTGGVLDAQNNTLGSHATLLEEHMNDIQTLDEAVSNLQNSTVTTSSFQQHVSTTNGQISSINGTIGALQTQVNSGFVKEVPLSETISVGGELDTAQGMAHGHFLANGRYTVFIDENTELVGAAGEGVVTVTVAGTDYILDENDELSVVISSGSIASVRKMQRASFAFDEQAIKSFVAAEIQNHAFTL